MGDICFQKGIAYNACTCHSYVREKWGFSGENSRKIRISNTEHEFRRPKPQTTKAILMEKEVKSFLDSVVAKNTRKTYIRGLELLEEHMEKTISEIIDERREDFKSDDVTHRRRLDRMHAETLLRFSPACLAASTTSRSRYRQVDSCSPSCHLTPCGSMRAGLFIAPSGKGRGGGMSAHGLGLNFDLFSHYV